MSQLDEVERQRLAEAVSQMEIFLHGNSATLGSATLSMLTRFIESAKQRVAVLDVEIITETVRKKEIEEKEKVALFRQADREVALTREEREVYSGFLEKDHFSRVDFSTLAKFYSSAWDRLSQEGKSEMSERIWEGVRRQEYKFSELPDIVKEKEAERLHQLLMGVGKTDSNPDRIPPEDREDFLAAWKAGKRKEAYEILDRPAFSANVAVSSREIASQSGKEQTDGPRSAIAAATADEKSLQDKPSPKKANSISGDADLSDIRLENLSTPAKPTELPLSPNPPSLKR